MRRAFQSLLPPIDEQNGRRVAGIPRKCLVARYFAFHFGRESQEADRTRVRQTSRSELASRKLRVSFLPPNELYRSEINSPNSTMAIAAKAGLAEGTAECEFGGGVFCPVGAHHPRDGLVLRHRRAFVPDVHCGFYDIKIGDRWTTFTPSSECPLRCLRVRGQRH